MKEEKTYRLKNVINSFSTIFGELSNAVRKKTHCKWLLTETNIFVLFKKSTAGNYLKSFCIDPTLFMCSSVRIRLWRYHKCIQDTGSASCKQTLWWGSGFLWRHTWKLNTFKNSERLYLCCLFTRNFPVYIVAWKLRKLC